MRKIKIIDEQESRTGALRITDYEKPINDAFIEIEAKGGKIIKTEYCLKDSGFIMGAIIEYEL